MNVEETINAEYDFRLLLERYFTLRQIHVIACLCEKYKPEEAIKELGISRDSYYNRREQIKKKYLPMAIERRLIKQ